MLKLLYPILFTLFFAKCQTTPPNQHLPVSTIDPTYLAHPPTPFVTPLAAVNGEQLPVVGEQLSVVGEQLSVNSERSTSTPEAAVALTTSAALGVPTEIQMHAQGVFGAGFVGENDAEVQLLLNEGNPVAEWVYVVAAPFATVTDEITLTEVMTAWQSGSSSTGTLVLDGETAVSLTTLFGQPNAVIQTVPPAQLTETLWAKRPSFTILPFHRLTPELKLLRLDGQTPLQADFDRESYPLAVSVGVVGGETAVAQILAAWGTPISNHDPAKLTSIAMTGVTALVRATAYQMEQSNLLYPGEDVRAVMRAADIAHVSNEVSFTPNCPFPSPTGGTSFCSRDSYFSLLEDIGADVIELTGNHLNDLGREYVGRSMEMYAAANMQTFGGGRNQAEAAQPAIFEQNGNHIAFVGCNSFGPAYAWTTPDLAGSQPCTLGFYAQIEQLSADGFLVIATLQYSEFYQYGATAQQVLDFQAVANAGATAVSGSQGHHAQGFAFHEGSFIHYGLGNLFFDQMDQIGTRQTFVDVYTIYDGQLINVDLWTGLIENYAKPRTMTPAEREQLLQTIFQASGW